MAAGVDFLAVPAEATPAADAAGHYRHIAQ